MDVSLRFVSLLFLSSKARKHYEKTIDEIPHVSLYDYAKAIRQIPIVPIYHSEKTIYKMPTIFTYQYGKSDNFVWGTQGGTKPAPCTKPQLRIFYSLNDITVLKFVKSGHFGQEAPYDEVHLSRGDRY